MKLVAASLAALAFATGALAERADFEAARDTPLWAGCVDQPGFEPYPVRLERTEHGFMVTYPGLCAGTHRTALSNVADATEIIRQDVYGVCIPMMMVDYALSGDRLTLSYSGGATAIAVLTPTTADRPAPNCTPSDLVS